MKTQIEELKALFDSVPDDVLENSKVTEVPWPTENTVGVELLDNCLRWLMGYRMQLFLYARSNEYHGLLVYHHGCVVEL